MFINTAHEHGIAVVFDYVPNHLSSHSIVQQFDGSSADSGLAAAVSPHATDGEGTLGIYIYPGALAHTPYGPRPNLASKRVRQWIIGAAKMWLQEYHFDGVRVDSTGTLRRVHAEDKSKGDLIEAWTLMQEFVTSIRKDLPHKYLIAEDLKADSRINSVAGFDSQWDEVFFMHVYRNACRHNDSERRMAEITHAICHSYTHTGTDRLIYTENHDKVPEDRSKRLPEAIQHGGGAFGRARSLQAAAMLLTSPGALASAVHATLTPHKGVPMLMQGQEHLELRGLRWPHPPPMKPHASLFTNEERQVFQVYQSLIRLRTCVDGISKGMASNAARRS